MRTQRPTTWKGFAVYVGILILSILLVFILVDKVVLPLVVSSTSTLSVPEVEGRTEEDAIVILEGRGLEVMPPHRQYSTDVKAGYVINQMPYAGATVKEGRRVYITVSKGTETASMPNLTGRTIREARLIMLRLGMQIGDVTYESNDSVPAEIVLYQSILSGTSITSDVTPSVVVSSGSSGIMVPSIVGLKVNAAKALVEQSELIIGTVRKQKSNTFESDVILFQDPQADSVVARGTAINVIVTE